ncbi:PREDICTED: speckle targeted PIP5K1A-regulated poly(A) polymerase-like [Papilio xuthus]|uniref:Speckle targeted PIP5K1A-regulated poly(A) polymerase-like n=1 Tax=Papilio xuthus TaxID=66420 RepID=A0AAJ7EDB7_PAPXU|nr:PREDICTED: speckle targeted PIP5K1A-regulated poly(A) polymerase-like [Papilio xuthus]XP_013172769.1 PREDICTED: speckle targeted PIP5K1A-regulated poly(A) polymerase-like [Papilio xuthus]
MANNDDILDITNLHLEGNFDSQVEGLMKYIRLTRTEVEQLQILINDLQGTMEKAWPGCTVHAFGSIVTGLGIKSSDLDCHISVPPWLWSPANVYVYKARALLKKQPHIFKEPFAISEAKIPIVKFYHIPTQRQCDITFTSPQSIENSKLLAYYMELDHRGKSLTILIKYWAKIHGLTGTNLIPNYAMILLVVFYLQQKAILPPVHRLQSNEHIVDNWNVAFEDVMHISGNNITLYDLLGGFFIFYRDFNYDKFIISPFLGQPITRESFSKVGNEPPEYRLYRENLQNDRCKPLRMGSIICLQDPFDHSRNCTVAVHPKLVNKLMSYLRLGATAYEIEKSDAFLWAILSMRIEERPAVTTKVVPRCIFKKKNASKKQKKIFHEAFIRARQKNKNKI